eukprot:scaffold21969_cov91-Isochrysis_galbana.AAC.3
MRPVPLVHPAPSFSADSTPATCAPVSCAPTPNGIPAPRPPADGTPAPSSPRSDSTPTPGIPSNGIPTSVISGTPVASFSPPTSPSSPLDPDTSSGTEVEARPTRGDARPDIAGGAGTLLGGACTLSGGGGGGGTSGDPPTLTASPCGDRREPDGADESSAASMASVSWRSCSALSACSMMSVGDAFTRTACWSPGSSRQPATRTAPLLRSLPPLSTTNRRFQRGYLCVYLENQPRWSGVLALCGVLGFRIDGETEDRLAERQAAVLRGRRHETCCRLFDLYCSVPAGKRGSRLNGSRGLPEKKMHLHGGGRAAPFEPGATSPVLIRGSV